MGPNAAREGPSGAYGPSGLAYSTPMADTAAETTLEQARRFYAEEIRFVGGIEREEVVEAVARVPRECFLPPPPWRMLTRTGDYRTVEGSDPRDTYHNVLFAIDEERRLNNGEPSFVVRLIDQSDAREGHHVVHIGCGTGYYAAVLAELVGESGQVTAIELDEKLAQQARENLAGWPNVEVKQADGSVFDPGAANAFLVNAGATHPLELWLDRLLPSAVLILPMTVNAPLHGGGWVLRVKHTGLGFAARFVGPVGIYPCIGARDDVHHRHLVEAYGRGAAALEKVQSLRRDAHSESEACWLHCEDFCLSTEPLG